jgi:hypothetical protein
VGNDELKKIRELSDANFTKMLKLVEFGLDRWWTASTLFATSYDILTEQQKERMKKSYEAKFGEFPDIESFLELGRKGSKFEEAFFVPYANHLKYHESDSKLVHPDPDCMICKLFQMQDMH